MAKYLVHGTYTAEGIQALQKNGASSRAEIIQRSTEAADGSCEAIYWTFGTNEIYVIVDVPNSEDMAAVGFAFTAPGLVRTTITPLMSISETDAALSKSLTVRATKT